MSDRTIIHIDLDAFFVSVEQVLNPELRGRPVVVGGRPGERGVIAAASYEAREYGLHSGMPLRTASRLCPEAVFVQGSFARYREASGKFMAILADFSPFIEPGGLDEAYLDVTGFESIYGSIREMAVKMKRRIKDETGLVASAGISSCKVVSKVASDYSKPDGLLEIPRGEEASFLSPLPVGRLPGVGKKTSEVMKNLGIKTIGELAALSPEMLRSRLGVWGESLHRHANGIDDRKIEPPGAAKSISRETTFSRDTRNRPLLKATLRYLGERVGADLRSRGRQAKCVTLKLRYSDFTTISRSETIPQPADSDRTIFATGVKLLEKALSGGKQPVRLIGIGVSSLTEAGGQMDMLDSSVRRMAGLDGAVDRIRRKYGFTSIQTGRTLLLRDLFTDTGKGYDLHTPGLSR